MVSFVRFYFSIYQYPNKFSFGMYKIPLATNRQKDSPHKVETVRLYSKSTYFKYEITFYSQIFETVNLVIE